jgi:hypothetical protein
MALHAVAVGTKVAPSSAAPSALATGTLAPGAVVSSTLAPSTSAPAPSVNATITVLCPAPRTVAVAAVRRERRKWMAIGVAVFASPFLACIGVLEVIH